MWFSVTPSAGRGALSIGTCSGSRIAWVSPMRTTPRPSRNSFAGRCRTRAGRARPIRSSCMAGASAGRRHAATSAPRATSATTIERPRWRGGPAGRMTRGEFENLVAEALRTIPRRFRHAMSNLAILVYDEPSPELLEEMEIEPPDTLFGLYRGTPLTERSWGYGNTMPDQILIFQGPHEREAEDDE